MMPPVIILKSVSNLKKELIITTAVILFVVCMPIVALISVTNVSALKVFNSAVTNVNDEVYLYTGSASSGDLYDFGNCTYWVSMRRADVGEAIPNSWGNAATWALRAQISGYKVDHTPSQYSIMQISNVDGGLGHVAFVEKVEPNGDWYISEMNVVGFDEVDDKTMLPSEASNFNFIHQK